jgi:hypothetical protein
MDRTVCGIVGCGVWTADGDGSWGGRFVSFYLCILKWGGAKADSVEC